jgi:radical SAM protein with 4Fe4S-binding SPASM domain
MTGKKFCVVPWINASVDVNGSFRPCCKFEQPDPPGATNLGNLKDKSLQELWNDEPIKKLRQEFLDGKLPTGCKACWDEEAAGIPSLRMDFAGFRIRNKESLHFESAVSPAPLALDLKLSNKCNLKCRICGPIASSTFLNEELNRPNGFRIDKAGMAYLTSFKFLKNEKETDWFIRSIPTLQHLELFGGEPLLGEENRQIVKLIKKSGHAQNITILYNTNTTLFDSDLTQDWREFKRVQVCLSVDDIEDRLEYQRFPSKWNVVQKNIGRYIGSVKNIHDLVLFCTVSLFNVYYIPEYLKWHEQEFGNVCLNLNFVHSPEIFNILNLNPVVKQQIQKKYEAEKEKLSAKSQAWLLQILGFMNSKDGFSPELINRAKYEVRMRDTIRYQSFEKTFPDWAEILFN